MNQTFVLIEIVMLTLLSTLVKDPSFMSQPDTKVRILDAAERLFGSDGFHATSLRTITSRAGVNLAAVSYHFGSKEALLEAVFERRLIPLNALRLERLEQVLADARVAGVRPAAREVLRAFIAPTLEFRASEPGADAFSALVGRAFAEADETVRATFLRHIQPVFLRLFEALAAALPEHPRQQLFWRLQFALGSVSHTLCMGGRLRIVPPGVDPDCDHRELTAQLLTFVTAGLEAP